MVPQLTGTVPELIGTVYLATLEVPTTGSRGYTNKVRLRGLI
jgi:hypothetical protein